jgi:hypothetical protein
LLEGHRRRPRPQGPHAGSTPLPWRTTESPPFWDGKLPPTRMSNYPQQSDVLCGWLPHCFRPKANIHRSARRHWLGPCRNASRSERPSASRCGVVGPTAARSASSAMAVSGLEVKGSSDADCRRSCVGLLKHAWTRLTKRGRMPIRFKCEGHARAWGMRGSASAMGRRRLRDAPRSLPTGTAMADRRYFVGTDGHVANVQRVDRHDGGASRTV